MEGLRVRHLRFQRNAGTEIRLFLILGGLETTDQTLRIHIAGYMSTIFAPESNRRYAAPQ